MEEYKRRFREFQCNTRLYYFAQHFKEANKTLVDKSVTKLLEVKFSKNWEECTLEDLAKVERKHHTETLPPIFRHHPP